ncbi:conserved hypothetical protein [Culex quinquefasciatus]|uniref:Ig-like domain-containing protein n=1 Tax=Culex quinquefasciatus TaxID=7176 RepID=B0WF06_CULQU|nr:conserved hypothetical protein [Culex quinquefasciatus]|eukprot:XP_001847290.1 conserved hypothetical protein [Culex quinquefasciatus]
MQRLPRSYTERWSRGDKGTAFKDWFNPPIVSVQLGSTLVPDDIKEGDDVYFECHVQSNPAWKKLHWFHGDTLLLHNASARVIQTNQSLVLQKLAKQSAGYYACSAINDEGETVSNQQFLRVKRKTFHWRFNNSAEILEVDPHRYSNHGNFSVLQYTPVTEQDYGTLSCWASNEIGTQSEPCLYQMILADLPAPVANCTVYNRTQQFAEVQCAPGYDGGLPQMFVLELVSKRTGARRFNYSNKHEPYFFLERLEWLTNVMSLENNSLSCVMYAVNQRGSSIGVVIPNFEIGHIHPFQSELLEGIIESRTDCVSFVCIFRQQQQQHQQSPPDGGNGNSGGGYAFVDYSANSYYLNPIDLTNLSSTMGLPPVSSSQEHHQDSGGGWSGGRPLVTATTSSAVAPPSATGSDLDINVIKDRLMTTRVPESCV